ncbi:1-propanol dehydrogenase PduQ [Propionibacterium freudenreichii]|uniref:PduQ n=1 Tax=Propionibacterium freudenreichii TaxID=1744 RepID=A0A2C7AUD1_9ACTN|nr:1-propanol dehydrogenase PduQ [Propionibacterium freudenreichii]MCT2978867.1 iron-containing alcohol dehydrogenase [Propionibacterium freudenreichii]MCT2985274.1 iron-containing alcohol dehydrogenase [Propionibacterium freudenreichii]MCT2986935.1 iron-containing alcohol dehydrogenase [Propionibacterium freudenreichii]CUW11225.1 Iron-containing alcohol dehydrogenase family protein [Propionibacterium freudenreichii subsp. shermanii]SPB31239.1 NAD-dependent methanol dehydrogenase [Propionibact
MKQFQLATSLACGPDALTALDRLDGRRVLVITDAFMASSALMDTVRGHLGSAEVTIFDQVQPNPDVQAVTRGLRAFLDCAPEALLALGGGSPIDTAKAVRKIALEQGQPLSAGFYVVPTTSGTGSEVSSFAVVTDPEHDAKLPMTSPDMVADVAILDPDAVRTCPPTLTADSGMDALSHAVEAYVALDHNDITDALAEKALRLISANLVASFRDGNDLAAREHQQNAATMAGIAFENSGLGIVHGLSHAIGGSFHVAHGRLNGILMPHVIGFNAGELGFGAATLSPIAERYAQLAGAIGIDAATRRGLVTGLVDFITAIRRDLDMPASLTDAGVDRAAFRAAIPQLSQTALRDFCTSGNPRPVTADELAGLLARAL